MLVSLKCLPDGTVPWFDQSVFFSEKGIVNLDAEGVWIVASYTGSKEWINERDPEQLLATLDPTSVVISLPSFVLVGEPFIVSGTSKHQATKLVLYFNKTPVMVPVVDGTFSRELSLTVPAEYQITKVVDPSTGTPLIFSSPSTLAVMM